MNVKHLPMVALLSLGAACGGSSSAGPPGTPDPTALGSSASVTSGGRPSGAVLVPTGDGPVGLALDSHGRIWIAHANANTVSRLSARGDDVDLDKPIGAVPLRLAETGGSVWVTVFHDGTLRRLDERTGRVTATVHVGQTPEGVAVAGGSLWVVLEDAQQLAQVDPESLRVTHRYRVGAGPRLVTAGHGLLWVSSYTTGRIIAVDPRSGTVRTSQSVCAGPQGMLVMSETVWVACTLSNELVGIDRRTLEPVGQLDLAGSPDAVRAGSDGLVLVALQKGPTLAVIDPNGPTVVRRQRLGRVDQLYDRANIDLVVNRGTAWVSSYLEGGIYRVEL